MRKLTQIGIGAAIIVAIAGGSVAAYAATNTDSTAAPTSSPTSTATSAPVAAATTPSATPTSSPSTAALTAPGAICDPHNLNDIICLAFHPDVAVINMTSGPRAQEPLRSMTDQEKIALAHKACSVYEGGGSAATVTLVPTTLDADAQALPADINNANMFNIGALAYCNQYLGADGATSLWTLNAYRDMGEKAAIKSFAGGHVVQRP